MTHARLGSAAKDKTKSVRLLQPKGCALGAAFAFLLLLGCRQDEPTGQVVASVNGEEITIPELNAEARARGLTIGDNPDLGKNLLSELVDRKLLAQEARQQKLDRTPEYLLAQRRADEILLAQQLISNSSDNTRDVTPQELAAAIKSNPRAFDQRVLIQVDQITVSTALTPQMSRAFESAQSLESIAALLSASRIPFSRRLELWDSASLSSSTAQRLVTAKGGGVVVLPGPQGTVAAHVEFVAAEPTPITEQKQVARELLQSQREQQWLQSLVRSARASAKIRYQPQFAPGQ
jgi:peptidyl-prolyl cis-trans isomerase C